MRCVIGRGNPHPLQKKLEIPAALLSLYCDTNETLSALKSRSIANCSYSVKPKTRQPIFMRIPILVVFLLLISFLFSCKREPQEQYPCPSDNERSGHFMCADISPGERFIAVSLQTPFGGPSLSCMEYFFLADTTYYSYHYARGFNSLDRNNYQSLLVSIEKPYPLDQKLTVGRARFPSKAPPGSVYMEYILSKGGNNQTFYTTDSAHYTAVTVKQLTKDWFFVWFEADLVRPSDGSVIKVRNGRAFIGPENCLYVKPL